MTYKTCMVSDRAQRFEQQLDKAQSLAAISKLKNRWVNGAVREGRRLSRDTELGCVDERYCRRHSFLRVLVRYVENEAGHKQQVYKLLGLS
jgi:hypothetical protein